MDVKKLTTAPLELEAELTERRLTNRKRGLDMPWPSSHKYVSLKKGYPIMIGGVGGAGKTELAFDIAINAACMYGYMFFVFSPETGDKHEIVEYIIDKVSRGKTLEKSDNELPHEEFVRLLAWANKHFRVTDPSEHWDENYQHLELNMDNLFQAVDYEEERIGRRFDGIIVDTFNDLDVKPDSMEVKNQLARMLAWTKKKNYLSIITNHVNDQREIREKPVDKWIKWTPPAKKEGWAYGQQFAKKGYQMLLIYEQHEYYVDERAIDGDLKAAHAQENFYNSRLIYVQKSKPKGVGRTGMFELFYDRNKNRYYDLDVMGKKRGLIYPEI